MKISTRHILAFSVLIIWALTAIAQQPSVTQITGMVRDSLSREGIGYASVSLVGTTEGTLANAQGGFTINSRAQFTKLRVSAMGYSTKEVTIRAGQGNVVLIDLVATGVELEELVVRKGKEKYSKKNNPAVEMIKRLRARRDDNDPRRHPHYGYTQYEKMSLGFADIGDLEGQSGDQKWIEQYADTSMLTGKCILPISIKETVARDYYSLDPDQHKQLILGTKHAGLDEQLDQSSVKRVLDDFMGEVNIFQNDVALLTNRFVSPLSRIAVDFYKFYLNDTVMLDGERCAVLSFVPIIATLFLFLSLLEDSGYMARIAFVMDKLLRRMGLSGRSIVPLLMGFGCSVPSIMACRTLPSERDRRFTIMLIPFMSCTAKLPVYVFFTALFFPHNGTIVIVFLYFLGVAVGVLMALLMKRAVFKGHPVPFVMELPNYRIPSLTSVMRLMWDKIKDFAERAFTIIFLATIVIWFLQTFDFRFQIVEASKDSMLALSAGWLSPAFSPLGFGDWRIVTSLVSGFLAKESIVSSLTVLFGAGTTIASLMTPPAAMALLVFCLLYTPCVATISTVHHEMGSRYAFVLVLWQCMVAWICAFVVHALFSLFF